MPKRTKYATRPQITVFKCSLFIYWFALKLAKCSKSTFFFWFSNFFCHHIVIRCIYTSSIAIFSIFIPGSRFFFYFFTQCMVSVSVSVLSFVFCTSSYRFLCHNTQTEAEANSFKWYAPASAAYIQSRFSFFFTFLPCNIFDFVFNANTSMHNAF